MKFQCSNCGACCKMAGKLGIMPSKEDGSCVYLDAENLCEVYDKRPDICNIEKMYYNYRTKGLIPDNLTKKDYYKQTTVVCNKFIDELGIDETYKLDPEVYDAKTN